MSHHYFFALSAARDRVSASPRGALRSIVKPKRTEAAAIADFNLVSSPAFPQADAAPKVPAPAAATAEAPAPPKPSETKADATTTAEAPAPAAEAPSAAATTTEASAPKPSPTKKPSIKPVMPGGRKKTNKKKKKGSKK